MKDNEVIKIAVFVVSFVLFAGFFFTNESKANEDVAMRLDACENFLATEESLNEKEDSFPFHDENEIIEKAIMSSGDTKIIWNQNYYNETSVKKNIYEKTYFQKNAGTITIYIKKTGNTQIKVNIYKSWWDSNTIDSATIGAGTGKTFVIDSNKGDSDCTTNNCYFYHRFTISVYAPDKEMSFYGYATITY